MIDTILLDLDNTILDFNKAEHIALSKALMQLRIEPEERILKRYSEINLAQWKLLELGKLTRKQVMKNRYVYLFQEFQIEKDPIEAAGLYERFLGMGHYYIDGAREALQALCKDYRLYIVTNGTSAIQRSRIESAELLHYIKDVFISEETGYNKPSKEYFDYCFHRIPDFQKERTIIVGDSLTSDILGGKNAGIKTVWVRESGAKGREDIVPDYEIESLSQLEKVLEELR